MHSVTVFSTVVIDGTSWQDPSSICIQLTVARLAFIPTVLTILVVFSGLPVPPIFSALLVLKVLFSFLKKRRDVLHLLTSWNYIRVSQVDSTDLRTVHRRSIVLANRVWLDCSDGITYLKCCGFGLNCICWRSYYVPVRSCLHPPMLHIHDTTTSWLSVSAVPVRHPCVVLVEGFLLGGSWLVSLQVCEQVGLQCRAF